jgi:hypothetical protein
MKNASDKQIEREGMLPDDPDDPLLAGDQFSDAPITQGDVVRLRPPDDMDIPIYLYSWRWKVLSVSEGDSPGQEYADLIRVDEFGSTITPTPEWIGEEPGKMCKQTTTALLKELILVERRGG